MSAHWTCQNIILFKKTFDHKNTNETQENDHRQNLSIAHLAQSTLNNIMKDILNLK